MQQKKIAQIAFAVWPCSVRSQAFGAADFCYLEKVIARNFAPRQEMPPSPFQVVVRTFGAITTSNTWQVTDGRAKCGARKCARSGSNHRREKAGQICAYANDELPAPLLRDTEGERIGNLRDYAVAEQSRLVLNSKVTAKTEKPAAEDAKPQGAPR